MPLIHASEQSQAPCVRAAVTCWGQTNESLRVLTEGLTEESKNYLSRIGRVTYDSGDLHHPR